MRKAQSISMVVVFILALFIGSLVLLFGGKSILKIIGLGGQATRVRFEQDLESEIAGLSYGSRREYRTVLPDKGHLAICFADLNYLKGNTNPSLETNPDYRVINESIGSGATANVFFLPGGSDSFTVRDLEVRKGFLCFNASAGVVRFGLEGKGNRTRIVELR